MLKLKRKGSPHGINEIKLELGWNQGETEVEGVNNTCKIYEGYDAVVCCAVSN